MRKFIEENTIGVIFFSLFALFGIGMCVTDDDDNDVFLVEETKYFHSSKKKGTCKFINQAFERGYKINRISYNEAFRKKDKICRLCFTPQQVQDYTKRLKEIINIERKLTKEQERRDSLVNSVSDEVREAIIEEYIEEEGIEE